MDWQAFDQEYVSRLRDGEPETQRHFSEYFGDLLAVKLRNRVRSPQLREDILQETFVRIFAFLRKHGSLDHPERLGAFVHTVCTNVLMEHFRVEGRISEMPDHMADPPDESENAESRLVTDQRKKKVSQVLEGMPEKDRDLIRKIFFEERDKDEVCREMNVDRDYLRVLLFRAKNKFKEGFLKGKAAAFALLSL